jgi:hypothetical protein
MGEEEADKKIQPAADSSIEPIGNPHIEDGTTKGAHEASTSDSPNNSSDRTQGNRPNFLCRLNFLCGLNTNEWLTLLLGLGSLAISALTYRTAADTTDLKSAVANLSTLAKQAARQANATDILSTAGRAFLFLDYDIPRDLTQGILVKDPDAATSGVRVELSINVVNLGKSPALVTNIIARLFEKADFGGGNYSLGNPDIAPDPNDPKAVESFGAIEAESEQACIGEVFCSEGVFGIPLGSYYTIPDGVGPQKISMRFFYPNFDIAKARALSREGNWRAGEVFRTNFRQYLYVIVQYKDVFGRERQSCFYAAGIGGAGSLVPGAKCNYWN